MARKNKNHHLEQRGDVWNFVAMIKGKRVKKAMSTSVIESRSIRDQFLSEIALYGEITSNKPVASKVSSTDEILFGEVAKEWVKIAKEEIKFSTLKDYKSAMNFYILPKFGNTPISRVGYLDIVSFRTSLKCGRKRKNNVLVPMRSVMDFALRADIIEKNPMALVKNLRVPKPDIYPLSMDKVNLFLEAVDPFYRNFFTVAFYTGMRFGEMAALKWKNVSFKRGIIKVRETRVRGEEGPPKTDGSVREIKMLPPVTDAMKSLRHEAMFKSPYVFLNKNKNPLLPNSINYHIWKPALKKAGLKARSLYQTRHTFATLMLDGGELPGWVQKMMGHDSLKMILEKYYSHIQNYQRDDGSAFMENVFSPREPKQQVV